MTLLRYDGEGHLITIAPTRAGKGVGAVVPNLLTHPGSVLVTDPKGELAAVTARARRALGQPVRILDPFAIAGGLDCFNPMTLVDGNTLDAIDDARVIADMLVVTEGVHKDGYDWDEEARALLAGLVLHVATDAPPPLRTLPYVRELLTLAPDAFAKLTTEMAANPAAGGLVARAAARLAQKADKERSAVISTAQTHTHFLDSPRMAAVLNDSSFDFAELATSHASAYLVLPPEHMRGYRRWLRLMVGCALLAVQRGARAAPRAREDRVLVLLDEFAHLGRMQPVEDAIALAAGAGVTFWLVVQDVAQLKGVYPERWASFVANAAVTQVFGTNDVETAEYVSKLTGTSTIIAASENTSKGVSRGPKTNRSRGEGTTRSEIARPLLTPDEVLRLPASDALVFCRGRPALRVRRIDYRLDPALMALADANPTHVP